MRLSLPLSGWVCWHGVESLVVSHFPQQQTSAVRNYYILKFSEKSIWGKMSRVWPSGLVLSWIVALELMFPKKIQIKPLYFDLSKNYTMYKWWREKDLIIYNSSAEFEIITLPWSGWVCWQIAESLLLSDIHQQQAPEIKKNRSKQSFTGSSNSLP